MSPKQGLWLDLSGKTLEVLAKYTALVLTYWDGGEEVRELGYFGTSSCQSLAEGCHQEVFISWPLPAGETPRQNSLLQLERKPSSQEMQTQAAAS